MPRPRCDEYAPRRHGGRPTQLYEATCDLDLELRGAVATVELRQRIVNPGPEALAASYEFDLPGGAMVTGFSLRSAGGVEQALAVPGGVPHRRGRVKRAVLGADPALLAALPSGASRRVRATPAADRARPRGRGHDSLHRARRGPRGRRSASCCPDAPAPAPASSPACRGSIRGVVGSGRGVQRIRVAWQPDASAPPRAFTLDATATRDRRRARVRRQAAGRVDADRAARRRLVGDAGHRGRATVPRPRPAHAAPRPVRDRRLAQHGARRPPQRQQGDPHGRGSALPRRHRGRRDHLRPQREARLRRVAAIVDRRTSRRSRRR